MSNFREMYFEGEIDGKGLLDEIDRLRAEVDSLRAFLPEVSHCVEYAIDYGSPSREVERRELLSKIKAAMGAKA